MSSILESLSSSFGPDVLGQLGKALGADTSAIGKGLGAIGPLALSGMSKMASGPGGADSLMKMLPQDGGGMFGNIGSMLSGLMGGGATGDAGANPVMALLGPGSNAVSASLSKALGFNVAPLLAMAVPMVMGAVSKLVKAQNLDASSLSALLSKEQAQVAADPARSESLALMAAATQAGNHAAATIASYGADWAKVTSAPLAALFAVSASDLSGPLGSIKEAQAAGKALHDAAGRADAASMLAAAFGGGLNADMVQQLKTLAPTKDKLIEIIRSGAAAVAAKSPGEARAYKDTILSVAQATAEAAKEGGFLGIGGTLVSQDEQSAIDAIKAALA